MGSPNVILICSDQHNASMGGWRQHPLVKTPNLDRLASNGSYFTNAYCNSPICTPSRMSFVSGRYAHEINSWTIGMPLGSDIQTWPGHLNDSGISTTMLGKMDYCGEDQGGQFTDHRILRRRKAFDQIPLESPLASRLPDFIRWKTVEQMINKTQTRSEEIISDGVYGEAHYEFGNYDHDRIVTNWALDWLRQKGEKPTKRPWLLYVGLLYPHPPFTVPKRFFDQYPLEDIDLPIDAHFPNPSLHPALRRFQKTQAAGKINPHDLKRTMAAYYGMITCLDEMIGEILNELNHQKLAEDTYIIYFSDHGESLGTHGLFFKKTAFEESVKVPLIISGPDLPKNNKVDDLVSLVDLYPTLLDLFSIQNKGELKGMSWLKLLEGPQQNRETIFSEYHGPCFTNDWYMLRDPQYKYIHYDGGEPSLFDLEKDPNELMDLGSIPNYQSQTKDYNKKLRCYLDPDEISRRAQTDLGLIGQINTT
jgi:choline-sulfatase